MAIEQMFTELPTVSNSTMSDIICAVQGYVSPSVLGLSTQQTLQQVFNLFQSNVILSYSGDPNGNVAGTTYQFLWDSLNSTLYICTTSGAASTAVWVRADINDGYTTTVTAGGTTTLTLISTYWQFFTGVLNQTVVMPVTSTLAAGMSWQIVNNSSGTVTIQSSGLNTITTLSAGQVAEITCILNSGTSAASWNVNVSALSGGVTSITGTANQVIASSPTGAVTLSLPQDIATTSSPTFANLILGGASEIRGANGLRVLTIVSNASAVNSMFMNNQVSGSNPSLLAFGSDTNIGLSFAAQAAGVFTFATTASTALQYQTGTAYQHITNFIFPNTSATRNVTWQDASGTVAYLSDVAGAVTSVTGTANQILANATSGTPQTGAVTFTLPTALIAPGNIAVGNMLLDTNTLSITNSNGNLNLLANGTGQVLLNNNTAVAISGITPTIAMNTTTTGAFLLSRFANSAASAGLVYLKSRGATINSLGAVQNGDILSVNYFYADDGSTYNTLAASMDVTVTGSVSTGIVPSQVRFSTMDTSGVLRSVLTMTNDQHVILGQPLQLAYGGSNAILTASNGGIVYSTASAMAVLAGTAKANQLLMSGASTTPAWSTTTYPATNAINTIMYASSANVLGVITPANSSVLISSSGGVPSWSTALPSGLTATNMNLTTPTLGVASATSINFGGGALSSYVPKTAFTPTFSFSTPGDLSVSYASQVGLYERVGNVVTYQLLLTCTPTFTTASGSIQIGGLPITVLAGGYQFVNNIINDAGLTYTGTSIYATPNSGQTFLTITQTKSATGATNLQTGALVSGVAITFKIWGSYFV